LNSFRVTIWPGISVEGGVEVETWLGEIDIIILYFIYTLLYNIDRIEVIYSYYT
jgi:hypothetical protein